jgi:hypothetical protein
MWIASYVDRTLHQQHVLALPMHQEQSGSRILRILLVCSEGCTITARRGRHLNQMQIPPAIYVGAQCHEIVLIVLTPSLKRICLKIDHVNLHATTERRTASAKL